MYKYIFYSVFYKQGIHVIYSYMGLLYSLLYKSPIVTCLTWTISKSSVKFLEVAENIIEIYIYIKCLTSFKIFQNHENTMHFMNA